MKFNEPTFPAVIVKEPVPAVTLMDGDVASAKLPGVIVLVDEEALVALTTGVPVTVKFVVVPVR